MRSRWEALRAGLVRSIRTARADREFLQMKARCPALASFSEPSALVAYMNGSHGDLDDKDRLIGALVTLVQSRQHADIAHALLWLVLWPGLDGAYRRRLKLFRENPEDLVSLLSDSFTGLIERLDLNAVRRTAATIVRSTERDMMTAARREWSEKKMLAVDVELDRFLEDKTGAETSTTARLESQLGWTPDPRITEDRAILRAWLEPIVGDDTDLLVAVLVLQETQREAGCRLGLTHEAARKRFQRALRRLRQHLTASMSQTAPNGCV